MTAEQRRRLARLDRILESHDAFEKRTMADLRVAGFAFNTIGEARRYQFARRTVEAMTTDQVVELITKEKAGTRA